MSTTAAKACVSINSVMAYKNPQLVQRLCDKEHMSGEDAAALFEDLKRFLYLCGTSKVIFGPSDKIDLAWHHFLLFTREYQRFCRAYFGKFIHHNPVEAGKRPKGVSVIQQTLDAAHHQFGELSENWTYPKAANCVSCSTPSTNCQD